MKSAIMRRISVLLMTTVIFNIAVYFSILQFKYFFSFCIL